MSNCKRPQLHHADRTRGRLYLQPTDNLLISLLGLRKTSVKFELGVTEHLFNSIRFQQRHAEATVRGTAEEAASNGLKASVRIVIILAYHTWCRMLRNFCYASMA